MHKYTNAYPDSFHFRDDEELILQAEARPIRRIHREDHHVSIKCPDVQLEREKKKRKQKLGKQEKNAHKKKQQHKKFIIQKRECGSYERCNM